MVRFTQHSRQGTVTICRGMSPSCSESPVAALPECRLSSFVWFTRLCPRLACLFLFSTVFQNFFLWTNIIVARLYSFSRLYSISYNNNNVIAMSILMGIEIISRALSVSNNASVNTVACTPVSGYVKCTIFVYFTFFFGGKLFFLIL